ncbi:multicopper oxidase domain-containing protein [Streptomyces sp. NPDC001709]
MFRSGTSPGTGPTPCSARPVAGRHLGRDRGRSDCGGHALWALTYNGGYLPPTLRIRPGDKMELAFKNTLGEETNLHVHGLHVSPSGDAASSTACSSTFRRTCTTSPSTSSRSRTSSSRAMPSIPRVCTSVRPPIAPSTAS